MSNLRAKIQPFAQKFFSEMLKLELQMTSKSFTLLTISQLSDMYRKAIEYYDTVKDPISSYFLEKLQMTLQSKESLRLIMDTDLDKIKNDQTAPNTSANNNSNIAKPNEIQKEFNNRSQSRVVVSTADNFNDLQTTNSNTMRKNTHSITSQNTKQETVKSEKTTLFTNEDQEEEDTIIMDMNHSNNSKKTASQVRLERAKSAYRYMKILEQKVSTQRKMTNVAQKYIECAMQNDQIIRKELARQAEIFRKRQERKCLKARTFKNSNILVKLAEGGENNIVNGIKNKSESLTNRDMLINSRILSNEKENNIPSETSLVSATPKIMSQVDALGIEANNSNFNKHQQNKNLHHLFSADSIIASTSTNKLSLQPFNSESNDSNNSSMLPDNTKDTSNIQPIQSQQLNIETLTSPKNKNYSEIKNQIIFDPKSEDNSNTNTLNEVKQKLLAMKKLRRADTTFG